MAERAEDDEFFLVDPEQRGQLDILHLRVPARLLRRVRQFPYRITIDTAFAQVIDACAQATPARRETWINRPIRDAFVALHAMGYAHSVEVWDGKKLVGGLYGLALGGVFCGESMFSRADDASKIALVHLCARLWRTGFTVLDTQFVNDHLKQFGVYEISRDDYKAQLHAAVNTPADFTQLFDECELINSWLAARNH